MDQILFYPITLQNWGLNRDTNRNRGKDDNKKKKEKMSTNNDQTERNGEEQDATKAESMTVARLRNELKRRKLKTTGNKTDLVEQFRAALVLENQKADDEDVDDSDDDEE